MQPRLIASLCVAALALAPRVADAMNVGSAVQSEKLHQGGQPKNPCRSSASFGAKPAECLTEARASTTETQLGPGLYYFGARYYDPQISTWLSTDPALGELLATRRAHMPVHFSLYAYAWQKPLKHVDPDGRDVVFLLELEGAKGQGHVEMLIQDGEGTWWLFSQSAQQDHSEYSTFRAVKGDELPGTVSLLAMRGVDEEGNSRPLSLEEVLAHLQNKENSNPRKIDAAVRVETTRAEDARIFERARTARDDYRTGRKKYDLYRRNCLIECQEAVEGGSSARLPRLYSPDPELWFEKLMEKTKTAPRFKEVPLNALPPPPGPPAAND